MLKSPPMRGRGLKPVFIHFLDYSIAVAPHAGAWIETRPLFTSQDFTYVAPHAGAWIETAKDLIFLGSFNVAPHAGAWIETITWTGSDHS